MSHNLINNFRVHLTAQDLSENTIETYLNSIRAFSRWFSATNGYNLSSESITAQDIKEFRGFLQISGQKPATINLKLAAINSLCNFWQVSPGIVRNVVQQTTPPRWLDKRDQGKLLKQIQIQENGSITLKKKILSTRNRVIIMVMLNTGLRVSEICNLEIKDLTINPRSGSLEVRAAKGNKNRTIPLNLTARTNLEDWIKIANKSDGLVFNVSPREIQRVLQRLSWMTGVECTPHTLRHTFAHNLASSGIPLDQVAIILGHDRLDTTRIYTMPGMSDLSAAVSVLD
jgi:site-specific recombinase XerD